MHSTLQENFPHSRSTHRDTSAMDDWQDAALTNRHLHNKVGKHGRGKGGKSNGAFDVHRTFGTYDVECPAAGKPGSGKDSQRSGIGRLEIYNLNEQGNALLGELILEGILRGTVILAGSRKVMKTAIRAFEKEEDEESESDEKGKEEQCDEGTRSDGVEENDVEVSEDDDRERRRYEQFEKNSFRSPKFWLKWQGEIANRASSSQHTQELPDEAEGKMTKALDQSPDSAAAETVSTLVTDSGYLVFTGNNCDKFQGTLNCQILDWNNVKMSGWKLKSQPARDVDVQWTV
ncbi:hypothetical protein BST61_g5659 [Cercospora zeina]